MDTPPTQTSCYDILADIAASEGPAGGAAPTAPAPEVPVEILAMLRLSEPLPSPGALSPGTPLASAAVPPPAEFVASVDAPTALPTVLQDDVPVFFAAQDRSRAVPLSWPVTYQGVAYDTIIVTRPTAREGRVDRAGLWRA